MTETAATPRWKAGEEGSPIGSELREAFIKWTNDEYQMGRLNPRTDHIVDVFSRWLLTTGDGSVALARINDCPRQLFLPFPDEDRPYVTEDEES